LEFFDITEDLEILAEDGFDWNIVHIDLIFAYEKEEKVEGAFEDGKFDVVIIIPDQDVF